MEIQRVVARAWLSVLLLCAAGSAFALDPNSLKPEGYVSDFARVLDANSRAVLEQYCGQVERATGVQMALVTIPSLEGDPIEDFANSLFRKWGVGKRGKDEGILLLLVIQDRKNRIEVGYGLEPILPDGFVGGVLRETRPYLRQQQYGQAMLAAAEQMGTQIAQAKNVSLDFAMPRPRARRPVVEQRGIPWPLLIVGIFVLLFLLRRGGGGGGFLAGMILGNVLGRSDRWGGGGFGGGGGGGGGFGGFGGGDSGGGGASSDW